MKSLMDKAGEVTSDLEANGDNWTGTTSSDQQQSSALGPDGEIEPLMTEGPAKMANVNEGDREDDTKAQEACWKCKYNWRAFLPVNCCCKRYGMPNFSLGLLKTRERSNDLFGKFHI